MSSTKARDIRDMSDEQIRLLWKDAAETLFRLKLQSQTEKLAAPSDVRKNRRTIARCQTILGQRGSVVAPAAGPDGSIAADAVPAEKPVKRRARTKAKARTQTRTQTGT
jgi:large subunit ribosomal protein L29